jgi:hypothetical protein
VSNRDIYLVWVLQALRDLGGTGTALEVSRGVWRDHEDDLKGMGDLFYSWQYDIRWAAMRLRKEGQLAQTAAKSHEPWMLTASGWSELDRV